MTDIRPHPGPLPQERENHSPMDDGSIVGGKFSNFESNQDPQSLFPLPEGEGQGEGERVAKILSRDS